MKVLIENKEYQIEDNEFRKFSVQEYCHLRMFNDVSEMERLIGLISEIANELNIDNAIYLNTTHGGFIPLNCSSKIRNNMVLFDNNKNHINNSKTNINNLSIKNISIIEPNNQHQVLSNLNLNDSFVVFANELNDSAIDQIVQHNKTIIITNKNKSLEKLFKNKFPLTNTNKVVYVPLFHLSKFYDEFKYFIKINTSNENPCELNYDNLINLCIMVKNGGQQFEQMLKENMGLIDKWTILDTGSTDNTIEIIKKNLIGIKKGNLYQEEFINFRDSRNRLLELAGEKCKYTLMLDDTYIIKGDLRTFLNNVRSDQFSDSFSLFIKSDDVEYGSNRILKSNRKLKYLYKIHEVIQNENNNNVIIPIQDAYINDGRFEYMEQRTMNRKSLDLQFLFEELEENPNNPRTYYYLGQTYNLLKDYENAFKWMMERVNHKEEGFLQEKVDACFEAARIANFSLNKPWNEVEPIYKRAYELDKERPDSLYFLGIHYYLENNYLKAFDYFKKAYEIGYPFHKQYSLKPSLSYYFLPKFLTTTCYHVENFKLGEEVAHYFLANNKNTSEDYEEIISWHKIYKYLNVYSNINDRQQIIKPFRNSNKPIFLFVADGGFNQWSGKNILTTGVGGSETYIIEMSRYIQQSGLFDVIVFCNCAENETFEGVEYRHLSEFFLFVNENKVHTCIVSRFSEYLPVAFKGLAENVYLVVHDLTPSGIVIPLDSKLKNVFCLTEWHVEYMNARFPSLKSITVPFYYGIDTTKFFIKQTDKITPYKFIYSSFPNRGLLPLLQMWPEIYKKYPNANLHIYSDVNGKWVNDVAPEQMKEVRTLLEKYNYMNINYHGWVDKQTLSNAWITSDFWFYPCIFMETFCLTALEAAITKTFVVTNDLAALQNTVGDRGAVIKGDASTKEWQSNALERLFYYMDERNLNEKEYLIEKNYEWACKLTWKNQSQKLLSSYIKPSHFHTNQTISNLNTIISHNSTTIDNFKPVNISEKTNHIELIINKTYKLINNDLLPLANKFGSVLEGGIFNDHNSNTLSYKDKNKQMNICDLLLSNKIEMVLEIGFNAGFSTLLMLIANNNVKITCVDICEYKYVVPCYEWISKHFPNRIEFIKGRSEDILPELIKRNRKYDMIHIDGGHSNLTVFHDIQNSIKLAKENTILIMDDYEQEHINFLWNMFVNYHKFKNYKCLRETPQQNVARI